MTKNWNIMSTPVSLLLNLKTLSLKTHHWIPLRSGWYIKQEILPMIKKFLNAFQKVAMSFILLHVFILNQKVNLWDKTHNQIPLNHNNNSKEINKTRNNQALSTLTICSIIWWIIQTLVLNPEYLTCQTTQIKVASI